MGVSVDFALRGDGEVVDSWNDMANESCSGNGW